MTRVLNTLDTVLSWCEDYAPDILGTACAVLVVSGLVCSVVYTVNHY